MKNVVFSLLDRLIDENPMNLVDTEMDYHQAAKKAHQSVRRDLENLLNTHCRPLTWNAKWSELEKSVINYGIFDFMGYQTLSKKIQQQFCQHILTVIQRYETRLIQVQVLLEDPPEQLDQEVRNLNFRIEGILQLEAEYLEKINYYSYLDSDTRYFKVRNLIE